MKQGIELNADVGESFGHYTLGRPLEVIKLINHALVACGFHAGDPAVMHQTVKWCKQYNVVLGAHPGFPDLLGFGRRYMDVSPEEVREYVIYQVGALKNFAEAVGIRVRTAKPHGALMNWTLESEEHAQAVLDGLKTIGPDFVAVAPALPETPYHELVRKSGIRLIREIYPGMTLTSDRGYVPQRKFEGDPQKEVEVVLKYLRTGKLVTSDGKEIAVEAESVCTHGDTPIAPEVILSIREALEREGVEIRAAVDD
ncbi:LamB/YcsF family protein [Chloroflexota bacterium]